MSSPRPRPGPLRWLGYAFGVGLPPRFRDWVLYDTTGPTWLLRQAERCLVMIAVPVAGLVIFLPGPVGLRVGAAAAGAALGIIYNFAYVEESVDLRLSKAGFPSGTAVRLRARRREQAAHRRTERVARQNRRRAERRLR